MLQSSACALGARGAARGAVPPPPCSHAAARRSGFAAGAPLLPAAAPQQQSRVRSFTLTVRAAKKGSKSAGGGAPKFKSPGEVKEGAAYSQETRKTILTMNRVSKTAPNGKVLLNGVGLGIYLGAKIGILGANGAGKSTLMRLLSGRDTAFEGDITVAPGLKIGYLEQEPPLNEGETVMENIAPGVAPMRAMLKEFDDVSAAMAAPGADIDSLMSRMEKLQNAIDAANGWELDRQVERAMDALRCPPPDAKVAVLSGGERRRVALCRLVLEAPDMLLLDEPTNHLDCDSVAWLETFLARFPGTVVAVTHDRFFLDNVAGWILELDRGAGIPFEGNYSQWLEAKTRRMAAEEAKREARERSIAAEWEYVSKQRAGQQKKGKARMRAYEELVEEAAAYVRNATLDSIVIPPGPRLGDIVVEAKGLVKGYGDRCLIDGLDFMIKPGSVVGVVGGNGAGKSTLFRMIMGQETPDGGVLRVGETVRPMCAEQLRDALPADKTVYQVLAENGDEIVIAGRPVNARAYCGWYGFKSGDQQKRVGDLSGGERNRLQLAKTLLQGGNLLLLDEPTNDLDNDTIRALENAIERYSGTTIIVSHDRWMLDRVATHILAFEGDSQVHYFEGSWSEYEADRRRRTGQSEPTRLKFRALASAR